MVRGGIFPAPNVSLLFPLHPMKRVVAVTGGIACGKSTVALTLGELGCEVLDTDDVAHDLESAGGEATPLLAAAFGDAVIGAGGAVDRRKLGAVVFSDPAALERLNSIIHPLIDARVRQWIASRRENAVCAVLVPLLFESEFDVKFKWDAIVAVVCSEEEQVRRVCARGFREDEARARIAAQMPCEEKAARADFAIRNNGTIADLRAEVEKVFNAISGQ